MKSSKNMPYHFGITGRIYPNYIGKQVIAINDGVKRKVYNTLVAVNNEKYDLSKAVDSVPAYRDRIEFLKELTTSAQSIKNMFPYMYDKLVDSDTITNSIANYKAAWNMYKKNPSSGKPTFHKKSYEQSYNTSAHYQKGEKGIFQGSIRFINKHKIHLPIIGDISFDGSPKIIDRIFEIENNPNREIRITTVTISKDAVGRYFCSILIASDEPLYINEYNENDISTAVGIDVNLTNLCTTSDGKVYKNVKIRKNAKKRLAKKQRKASKKCDKVKKQKRDIYNSKNYQKARKKLALEQSRNAKTVENYLHVVAKDIVNNHDYIFVENIKIKNLLKNHKLAFAIADVSWGKFFAILEAEAKKQGKIFMKVPPKNTTQTCSVCGHVCKGDEHITLGIEEWVCPECGTIRPRDENAADNIKQRGLLLLSA